MFKFDGPVVDTEIVKDGKPSVKIVHNMDCARAFRNYDMSCPRCQQLARGEAPRKGWGRSSWEQTEDQRVAAIRAHDCKKSGCGPVCTAFDW